ncbi:MAG: 2-nitropropane dioxygenase [Acidobacteriota bacterium]
MERFTLICPCCEATLTIDAQTGAIISHEEKKRAHGSFEDLAGELSKKKELREQLFAQEMSSQKDRERLLDEKFKEALKRADTDSDKPFRNPLDLD